MEAGVELGLCSSDGVFGGPDTCNFLLFEPREWAGLRSAIKVKADEKTLWKHLYRSVTFWPFGQAYEQDRACLSRPQDFIWRSKKWHVKHGNRTPPTGWAVSNGQAVGNRYLLVSRTKKRLKLRPNTKKQFEIPTLNPYANLAASSFFGRSWITFTWLVIVALQQRLTSDLIHEPSYNTT